MSSEVFPEGASDHTKRAPLGQGLVTFHDHPYADVDIVAVPGLGANPKECWTCSPSPKRDNTIPQPGDLSEDPSTSHNVGSANQQQAFNWIRDDAGLKALFPNSRIMLYDYASAWTGKNKQKTTMRDICTVLLDNLQMRRQGATESSRPLLFIGHSMGGLVIAKSIIMAKSRTELEPIVTCTVGCAFFGTPFQGTAMAKFALFYSSIFGQEAYESLLILMKSENETLEDLTQDFLEISNKSVPPIDLFCAYEQTPMNFAEISKKAAQKLPSLLGHKVFSDGAEKLLRLGFSAFDTKTHFVEKKSAVLQGAHQCGLTAGHRDLIHFESVRSPKFTPIQLALSKMIHSAGMNIRKRMHSSGKNILTQRFVNRVRQSLEGIDMRQRCRVLTKQHQITSWLISEPLYQQWLSTANGADPHHPYLWVKGGPGLGKSKACLAAIQQIGQDIDKSQSHFSFGQSETFLAYFLCEWTPGCSTAEELLKGLITQLINQEESLAQHARTLVPNPQTEKMEVSGGESGISHARATATVENLWRCLQDIIDDPATKQVYIIISNIHCLDNDDATSTLLQAIGSTGTKVKWLVTSRKDRHIAQHLTSDTVQVIDLENNDEYGAKVKLARQKHTKHVVSELRAAKQYSADLAYFVRNSIDNRMQDEKWIDIVCLLLKAFPSDTSSLAIRKWLREIGEYNFNQLVNHAWRALLDQNEEAKLEIEELLRALTIAYEPPTLEDLSILTQIGDLQRIGSLVRKCSPIIQLEEVGDNRDKVIFTKPDFREHLFRVCHDSSDPTDSQTKRYHGLLALRCFKHIKSYQGLSESETSLLSHVHFLDRSSSKYGHNPGQGNAVQSTREPAGERESVDVSDPENSPSSILRQLYPIKHLFQHLGQGFPDVAEDLCDEDPDFWSSTSRSSKLRARWLQDFQHLMPDFKDLNTCGMSALHVAAAIGANELISVLVKRGGEAALSYTSDNGMTALHVAAFNNHYDAVDSLVNAGASIDAGNGEVGTPLHFAALRGNIAIMGRLIDGQADVNALSIEVGPVINAAIKSGKVDAVKKVMEENIRFDIDYHTTDSPLSLSAGISEPSLFEKILATGKDKWLDNTQLLDQALLEASSGRLDSVRILLDFPHVYSNETLQQSVSSAAQDKKWASVNKLLDYAMADGCQVDRQQIMLNDVLYLASVSRDDQQEVLNKIWAFKGKSIPAEIYDFALYETTALKKNLTIMWLLDTCGASPNATAMRPKSLKAEYPGITPAVDYWNVLNAAASTSNTALVEYLIHRGAAIDTGRDYALQLAAKEGHAVVVEVLLECGASVDRQVEDSDELGFFSGTALQAACDNNKIEVVQVLIEQGADPNLGGGPLSNPITAATQRKEPDILKLLLTAPGIDVNVTGGDKGSTPLINAATNMSAEMVELLLQKNAEVNSQNADGDTALIMAASRGNEACVEMLCNQGADVTYRSPNQGLAIQACAPYPRCAYALAERMGATIADYREEIKFHQVREELRKCKEQLQHNAGTIKALTSQLEETTFEHDEAKKEIKHKELEKEQLLAQSNYVRKSHKSMEQELEAKESERKEIRKQRETSEEQLLLANGEIQRLNEILSEQKSNNAALRNRYGWTALEEEKHAAITAMEEEQIKRRRVESDVEALEQTLEAKNKELDALQATVEKLRRGRSEKHDLVGHNSKTREDHDLYSHDHVSSGAIDSQALEGANTTAMESPNSVSSSQPASPRPSPYTTPTSPDLGGESPSSESNFRTVHGQHRADGSFGGYRQNRGIRRLTSSGMGELVRSGARRRSQASGSS